MPNWSREQLAYCSNVHPGISPEEINNNLCQVTAAIRQQRGLRRMQVGLWINQDASVAYQSPEALVKLQQCLAEQQLDIVTLNGFPQGDFHQEVVKDKVYLPSWAQQSRLEYTIAIAKILASCLPLDQAVGTISTLPLGYRLGWDKENQHLACRNLCLFTVAMAELEETTGKQIRLCLEMEPGCVLENTPQVIELFSRDLPLAARAESVDFGLVDRYLGVCYDVCHQAVMQESVEESLGRLHSAGITIGKIQVSSALQIDSPAEPAVRARLMDFAEPKYLHQMSSRDAEGKFVFCDDLSDVLAGRDFPDCSTWWVHFHIPIQIDTLNIEGISTTRSRIEELFDYIAENLPYAPHIEVETYTWDVLPDDRWSETNDTEGKNTLGVARLVDGISDELAWLEQLLTRCRLLK